jgi:hypothetical protein
LSCAVTRMPEQVKEPKRERGTVGAWLTSPGTT